VLWWIMNSVVMCTLLGVMQLCGTPGVQGILRSPRGSSNPGVECAATTNR
jgi:hypothetical protein